MAESACAGFLRTTSEVPRFDRRKFILVMAILQLGSYLLQSQSVDSCLTSAYVVHLLTDYFFVPCLS